MGKRGRRGEWARQELGTYAAGHLPRHTEPEPCEQVCLMEEEWMGQGKQSREQAPESPG